MTRRPCACALLAAACQLPFSPALQAQSPGGGEALPLETVIVSARRIEQTANDVGMSIQAFTGEQLERLRISDVDELTMVVPAFTVAQSYQGVPTYTLRGVGFNTINLSATSTVGTYLDEVAYPYPVMNAGPVFDLQRVEVLKGPQGTLYGRNTTAGLINLVTNKPTEEFQAALTGEVGNFETANVEAMISGPLFGGSTGRVSLRREYSGEGWQESNSGDGDVGEVDRLGLRAALTLPVTERLSIDLSYNGWRNDSDTLAAQGAGLSVSTMDSPFNAPGLTDYLQDNFPGDNDEADWAPESVRGEDIGTGLGLSGDLEEDSSLDAFALRVAYELDASTQLISLSSYQDLERNALVDFGGVPYEILLQELDGSIESFSQELRILGEGEKMTWSAGAYYASDEILDSNRTLLGENANVGLIRSATVPLLATPFNTGGYTVEEALQAFRTFRDEADLDVESWSVFGSLTRQLRPDLSLTAGIRYTEDSLDYAGCSRDFNGNMLPSTNVTSRALFLNTYGVLADEIDEGDCITFDPESGTFGLVESKTDEDNVAWRLALDWFARPDTLLYASIAQGYKAGNTPVNAANLATQNAPVGQEKLLAYEIGVKATLLDQRMQLNTALFYYDYKDKQLAIYFADPIFTVLARLANIPDSHAYGLDTELTWRLTNELTAIAAVTLLHTEVEDFVGIDGAGEPQDYDGADFLYSPEAIGSLALLYNRPLNNALGFGVQLNGRYQSDAEGDFEASEEARIDSYGTLNAGVSLYPFDRRWEFSLWGANLTDEYYWLAVTQNANTWVRLPGKSRTYGATFTYRF